MSFKFRIQAAYPVSYSVDIYRIGYYGGKGARKIKTISGTQTVAQAACAYDATTGLVDCSTWSVLASWNGLETNGDLVPSGVYVAKLSSPGIGASHMIFVVRNDGGCADLLFQTADTTWQAYNVFSDGNGGGQISLYSNGDYALTQPPQTPNPALNIPDRAYKVSYNRPFWVRGADYSNGAHSSFFNAEYPMVRWLEANGYNVSYFTAADTDRYAAEILEHKIFLSVGHDEYWSGGQRANVEAARAAGVHLAFFAGNEIFWKIRWENNHQTLVCYKETHANAKIDPLSQVWSGLWRDARFGPHDGGRPENGLLGNIFTTNIIGVSPAPPASVSSDDGELRLWRNTAARDLPPGTGTVNLPLGTLGYEYDTDLDNGFRPRGLVRLSTTPGVNGLLLGDAPYLYTAGTRPHHITMYRNASGALVFSAGTIQWSWGLDCHHDRGENCPTDAAEEERFHTARQATVNLFLDMGVMPGSDTGLNTEPAPADFTAPSSTITTPAPNTTTLRGTVTIVNGTAADSGGLVAAVEVTDDGTHWHHADGRSFWSYAWTPVWTGAAQVRSSAVDDSANQESPGASVSVHVAHVVPGEIQAEDFDRGGELVGYHDDSAGNSGNSQYRPGESVDITQCPSGCNRIVGYVKPMEWLQYTIQVAETGLYTFAVRGSAGAGGQFHIEVDGNDVTGSLPVPATADSWTISTTWKFGVTIEAGRHVLKLFMVSAGNHNWVGNFDSIRITRAFTGTPFAVPGSFEAEHFDKGGEGAAYHDTTPGNSSIYPSTLRADDAVDLTACPANTHCGVIAGYVYPGEWLQYNINVAGTATYDVLVEGTNGFSGGLFHVEVDGVDKTGPLSVPSTGDNWVVGTARKTGVTLTSGFHALQIVVDQAPPNAAIGNFDAIRIIRRPFAVPGPAIEAEDFDGADDTTPGNAGNGAYYRAGDVDLTICPAGSQCRVIVGFVKSTEKLRYLIDVPTTGLYTISLQGTNGNPDAFFRFNVDEQPVSGLLTIPNTGSNWVVGTVTVGGISLQAGTHTLEIEVVTDGGGFAGNFDKILISRAYDGTPFVIPGSFQAEHFDHGGEGVAYHDTTPGNASIYPSNLRQDTGVDLTACPANTQCGIIIGYVKPGEWLQYSINVAVTATYDILAEGTNGLAGGVFHIELDGADKTGPLSIPVTGDNWVVGVARATGVNLVSGYHTLRIVVDQAPNNDAIGNFDAIRIVRRPFVVQGPAIEAEDFDAWSDTTPGNVGNGVYYRTSDVDLTVCPAGSQCRVIVGYVKAGEWLEYDVNAVAAGTYAIEVQGTNGNPGGAFHIEIDPDESGRIVLGSLAVPNTGSNWVVGTVTTGTFSLSAGTHTVRIVMDQDAGNWVGNFDLLRFIQP